MLRNLLFSIKEWFARLFPKKKVNKQAALQSGYEQIRYLLDSGKYCGMRIRRKNSQNGRMRWVVKVSGFSDAYIFFARIVKFMENVVVKKTAYIYLLPEGGWLSLNRSRKQIAIMRLNQDLDKKKEITVYFISDNDRKD